MIDPALLAAAAADTATAENAAQSGAAAPAASAAPQPVKDPKAEAADLLQFAGGLLFPLYPSLAKVYTPEVIDRLATASAPLLTKYGVNLEAVFGRFGPEIGFAIVAVPLIAPTVAAIRADRKQLEAAAVAPAAPAPAAQPAPEPMPLRPAAPVKTSLDQKFPGLNAEKPSAPTVAKAKRKK